MVKFNYNFLYDDEPESGAGWDPLDSTIPVSQ